MRDTADINIQFAPTENLSFDLHYFKTDLDATNTNQNFLLFGGCCGPDEDGMSDLVATNGSTIVPGTGYPLAGTLNGGSGNPGWAGWLLAQDVNSRKPELTSDIVDFSVDYQGDSFAFHGSIGSTSADGGNGGNVNSLWGIDDDDSRWVTNGGNLSADFDMSLPTGMYMAVNGLDLADPSWQTNLAASIAEVTLYDEEDWVQADLEFDVEWQNVEKIKVGFKTRDHVFGKTQVNHVINTNAIFGGNTTLETSGFFGGTINVSDVLASGSSSTIAGVSDSFDAVVRNNITASVDLLTAFGEVEEQIDSFYVQADFSGEDYRGNFGVRYTSTDTKGTTYSDATAVSSKFSNTSSYSDVLPSFNLSVDLAEDVILRTSAAKVLSRPAYGTLNPAIGSLSETQNTGTAGNIGLLPFRANQYDLGVEWYLSDLDYIGAAVFYKAIESFVTSGTIDQLVYELNGDQNAPDDLETYRLTVPVAGDSGYVQGVELNFQKNFGSFGILANMTMSASEGTNAVTGDTFNLPGSSKLSYNLTAYKQTDVYEARLTYTYRDSYLAEGTALAGSLDVFDEQAYLDGSITWHATDYLDVSFEGINLTGEQLVQRHGAGSLRTPRVTTDNGTRYYLKASVNF